MSQYPYQTPSQPPAMASRFVDNSVNSSNSGSSVGSNNVAFSGGVVQAADGPPSSYSGVDHVEGRQYRLEVCQQPQRARMCGFGDKDRRPITPPPCIRLVITDMKDGKEIDINDIDHGFFVLNVDLWSANGHHEVNLVRHTAASPSHSPGLRDEGYYHPPPLPAYPSYGQPGPHPSHGHPYSPQRHPNGYGSYPIPPSQQEPPPPTSGMYTRNLIGSLSASAFRLTDPADKIGIWFVLQDLSVRTEGSFRLRFSFVNVGAATRNNSASASSSGVVTTGSAPILASCYSEVFTVYSAKKFPGVVESTPLSKCFATQGIKIPIRKDGPGKPNKD